MTVVRFKKEACGVGLRGPTMAPTRIRSFATVTVCDRLALMGVEGRGGLSEVFFVGFFKRCLETFESSWSCEGGEFNE